MKKVLSLLVSMFFLNLMTACQFLTFSGQWQNTVENPETGEKITTVLEIVDFPGDRYYEATMKTVGSEEEIHFSGYITLNEYSSNMSIENVEDKNGNLYPESNYDYNSFRISRDRSTLILEPSKLQFKRQ